MFAWKNKGLLSASLIGLGLAVVLTAALCLVLTPLFSRELLPLDGAAACAMIAAGASVLAVVYILSRSRGKQALPAAGIVGGGFIALAVLACALGGSGCGFGPWLPRLAAITAAGALLGAIMSLGKKPGRRRRGKRRRSV